MQTSPDDSELVRRSQAGNLEAFNQLVLRYQNHVYSLCLRFLSSPTAAEDAAQDAFIAAFRGIRSFRGGSPGRAGFRAWLLRIAANTCYDELRRRRARPAISLETAAAGQPADLPASGETPDERAQRRDLADHLQQSLAFLPFDQRLAVILCDVQGLSYEEIAQATDASLGTVKSRIARGRARLRDLLLQQRELLPDPFRRIK